MTTVWTIGHSNHAAGRFLGLLEGAGIAHLADVRSRPASRFCPQFNERALAASLAAAGIGYAWLGRTLGGKPADPALLRDGRPDYARMAAAPGFAAGIEALLSLAAAAPTAIMCAERAPQDCHRTHLVTPALCARGIEVIHILADGTLQPHRELRLL